MICGARGCCGVSGLNGTLANGLLSGPNRCAPGESVYGSGGLGVGGTMFLNCCPSMPMPACCNDGSCEPASVPAAPIGSPGIAGPPPISAGGCGDPCACDKALASAAWRPGCVG